MLAFQAYLLEDGHMPVASSVQPGPYLWTVNARMSPPLPPPQPDRPTEPHRERPDAGRHHRGNPPTPRRDRDQTATTHDTDLLDQAAPRRAAPRSQHSKTPQLKSSSAQNACAELGIELHHIPLGLSVAERVAWVARRVDPLLEATRG